MKTIIHVNKHHIAYNDKHEDKKPVYTIKQGKKTFYGREVIIHGPSKLIYNGTKLSCGAKAWIETEAKVEIIDQTTYGELNGS